MGSNTVSRGFLLLSLLALQPAGLVLIDQDSEGLPPRRVRVDCARGETLAEALIATQRPLVVEFTGTCVEDVTIPGDDITLAGGDATATVVGTVAIFGRSRVTLQDFVIRDTPVGNPSGRVGQGIAVVSSQSIRLRGMRLDNTGNLGMTIEGSTATVTDCSSTRSIRYGLGVFFGSVVEVNGTLDTSRNRLGGILISDTAQVQMFTNAQVTTSDNEGGGLIVQLHGRLTLHGGVHLTVSRNGFGVLLADMGGVIYSPVTIDIVDNAAFGLQVGQLSDWTLLAGPLPNLTIARNGGPGVLVSRQAFVRMRENTTISGNAGPGVVVDGAGVAIRGATIEDNNGGNGDVVLAFGSNATFDGGNTVPTPIFCDGTSLVRGQFRCGAPLTAEAAASFAASGIELDVSALPRP